MKNTEETIKLTNNAINALNALQNKVGDFKELQNALDLCYEQHTELVNFKAKNN